METSAVQSGSAAATDADMEAAFGEVLVNVALQGALDVNAMFEEEVQEMDREMDE